VSVHVLSWALRHSEARQSDRLVLLVLADHAKDDGTAAWPSVETIARQARISERQAQRALRSLEGDGEIRATGKSKSGTTVWEISGYRRHENLDGGVSECRPGGDTGVAEGVTSAAEGGDVGVTRSVPRATVQDPSTTSRARGTVVALPNRGSAGWKVARKAVTPAEDGLARAVLSSWNLRTGQSLVAKEWLAKIVLRIREHPELDLTGHERVIDAALADPWWTGAPTVSVVYGNGAQFERCIVQMGSPAGPRPARYGRGLSARQVLERYAGGGSA